MRKISKLLAIILSVAIICAALPLGVITANAETEGYYTYSVSDGQATIEDCSTSISGKVTIPSTLGGYPVTSIGDWAFEVCESLTSVTIPDSVTSIGRDAFYGCAVLTSVTIGNGVTSIGDYAFEDCTGLSSITISNSVTNIGYLAFFGCTGLTSITVKAGNTVYHSGGNCLIETGSKALILGCKNSIIPDDGSVTSIGGDAFAYSTGLTSITIPNSVTIIDNGAFVACTGLKNITIPNSVTSIGYSAFSGCTGLTSITIGKSVTSIAEDAFHGCTRLTSITIPNSVTSIGECAFYGCAGLESIEVDKNNPTYHSAGNCIIETASKTLICGCKNSTIPSDGSVTSIDDYAFYGCTGLANITIPNSVTSIGGCTFADCTGLTSVNIPNSVTSLGYAAFADCTGLTSVTIGNSVTSIGGSAFEGCTGLTSVTIGNSVTSIGGSAFEGCTGLTSVTIPDSVTSIGYEAFYGCTSLTSTIIGNNVTTIGDYAFQQCTNLESITVGDSVTSIGSFVFSGTAYSNNQSNWNGDLLYLSKYLIDVSSNYQGSCSIKDGTLVIAKGVFMDCAGLTDITIPSSLIGIGEDAFYYCSGLESITVETNNAKFHSSGNCLIETVSKVLICGCNNSVIPVDGSVTSIDNYAFSERVGLTNIAIPSSVTSIGDHAFCGCSELESITIANSVTSIGDLAFWRTACFNDESNRDEHDVLYIDSYLIDARSNISRTYTIKNGTLLIADNAFEYCCELENVTIPNSVKYIGNCAFSRCDQLANIVIPESVSLIGEQAFYNCYNLTSVTIPNSVISIGRSAFSECTGLTSVTIPNSVTSIGNYAFSYCTGLESIEVDINNPTYHSAGNCIIETASKTLICGCNTSIIPSDGSVTSIDDYAFDGCIELTSITIPDSVTSIGYYAFSDCGNLKTVYYFGTPEEFATLVTGKGNDWLLDLDIVYMQQLESNDIELTAKRGVLEEGTVLSAEKIDSNLEQISEQLPEYYDAKSIVVYELSLTKGGEKVEFDGTVTVTVPLPEGMNPNKCRVLYMADDGSLTDMNAVYKDGAMVFDTTHFSTYILAESTALPGDLDGNSAVTDADAVYLLMYTFFPDDYPINQDCDFDGDGAVTDADAVYLLMYTFFPDDYPVA